MLLLSFLGFVDAAYLTVEKLLGNTLRCGVSSGCNTVAQSQYSSVGGVPLALFGGLAYLGVFFGVLIYREFRLTKILKIVCAVALFDFLLSLFLIGLQAFVIQAWCRYCLLSAGLSTIIFLLALNIAYIHKKSQRELAALASHQT